jgi:hypothetical protein
MFFVDLLAHTDWTLFSRIRAVRRHCERANSGGEWLCRSALSPVRRGQSISCSRSRRRGWHGSRPLGNLSSKANLSAHFNVGKRKNSGATASANLHAANTSAIAPLTCQNRACSTKGVIAGSTSLRSNTPFIVRLHRHTKSAIKNEPCKGKHGQNDTKKSHERFDEMVHYKPDDSVYPCWQKDRPNNAENSAQKSCGDDLHANVKK